MQGNVAEWCSDWYSKSYYGKSPSSDPTGLSSGGTQHLIRGGSWRTKPWAIRSAYRDAKVPTHRDNDLGFRVALVAPETPSESPSTISVADSRPREPAVSPPRANASAPTPTSGQAPPGIPADSPRQRVADRNRREVISNSLGMTLIAIPAGKFEMGTRETNDELLSRYPDAKVGDFNDERPAHSVEIPHKFYLGQDEVTLGQFREFSRATDYKTDAEKDGKGGQGWTGTKFEHRPEFAAWNWGHPAQTSEHPVVNVSWNDAMEFCQWLSKKEGRRYRLPTEAEWDYACRATTDTQFSFGDDPEGLARIGNVADATAKERFSAFQGIQSRDGYVFTAPVGRFEPNGFGLHDMHGNVREWCLDWYAQSYTRFSASNPTGPASGKNRVVRGGGWMSDPWRARSSYRWYSEPANRHLDVGFRVVLVTADAPLASRPAAPGSSSGSSPARSSPPPSPPAAEPGKVITNGIGMKLVSIPPGEFDMGSQESPIALIAAMPVHSIRITRPFFLGVHEVTLGQFLKFYHAAKHKADAENDASGGWGWTGTEFTQRPDFVPWNWGHDSQANDHPVVNVSWNDALAFCQWLSREEGKKYRLPTEAEWEYACRAGSKTRYSFGSDSEDLARYANVADAAAKAKWELYELTAIQASDGHAFTAPVGSFRPNAFGLFDMHGNASEWCSDWFDEDYYGTSPSNDPLGPLTGSKHVLRGGSWYNRPFYCRSAYRTGYTPEHCNLYTGFRVVLEASDP
jgi:formylglycine-generating enzyme required for sulfatase activity